MGFSLPLDDEDVPVMNDPLDGFSLLDFQSLGKGGGTYKVKLAVVVAASQNHLRL
jgi:hypothetical protein